ncbi:stress response protein NST1-like isoform X2 [Punica granatum]|uniref:Uncharacterized protein n=2 Tax=Punica granatum TaxID=22663 RepID=A0A218VVV5_PUNGR|nr:stress response protein NST1-like isoform X2 [Punica granatum]OWM64399.1 hypothetical protein CDL15_Pgr020366 [Punica granatum]PKI56785.1 hypothetical protein CRG98_022846 [Punica granatum]
MKRKKWSELEEQTLLDKYSEFSNSGALSKLKTREKKFKPIADHVNAVHHLQDPSAFPFKWSWRDVSIKVQNMRHQYLGVKQKIRVSNDEFNWKDGENHWENFLRYKQVFGDVELEVKGKKSGCGVDFLGDQGFADLGLRYGIYSGDEDDEEEEEDDGDGNDDGDDDEAAERGDRDGYEGRGKSASEGDFGEELQIQESGNVVSRKSKKGFGFSLNKKLGLLGAQALELRDVMVRKEEKRREREFGREKSSMDRQEKRKEMEFRREMRQSEREERVENRELELEERELMWARREFNKRLRLEREFEEERRRRRRMEERREEEEMEWRERLIGMQMEHEKAMMQMHAEAYQNQMQIVGVMARLVCQFFGSTHDALAGGLGGLPPQVLQNLQHHPGDLGDNGKPDANSPSEFM